MEQIKISKIDLINIYAALSSCKIEEDYTSHRWETTQYKTFNPELIKTSLVIVEKYLK